VQPLRREPAIAPMPEKAAPEKAAPKLRQHIRFCSAADGVRLAFATVGNGTPLVKAANWLGHLEFEWDSPVWRHWIAALARDHCFLRHDARGCGLSDRAADDLSFEALVRDFETVVDAAGFGRFPILGISAGAPLAIAYAARHPERVTHLVLHGAFLRGPAHRQPSTEQREMDESMVRLVELGWGQENPAFRQLFTSQFIPEGTPEQHRWFNELERVATSPQTAAALLRMLYRLDVTALAARISCPTLVLHATGDARVPFDEGRLVASLIPGARFVPIASNNHLLLEQEPAWPQWLEEVRAFLPAARADAFTDLTVRERELLDLIAQGLANPQIAHRLSLSAKTVKNHVTSIFAKLGIASRARAIVLARDAGLGRGSAAK